MIHEIYLSGYTATVIDPPLTLGTYDSYGNETIRVSHSSLWDGLAITATFHPAGGSAVEVLVGADGIVTVPHEATEGKYSASGKGSVVFCGTASNRRTISCSATYNVSDHASVGGANSDAPTQDKWQQFVAEVAADRTAAQAAAEAAAKSAEEAKAAGCSCGNNGNGGNTGDDSGSATAAAQSAKEAAASAEAAAASAAEAENSATIAGNRQAACQMVQQGVNATAGLCEDNAKNALASAEAAAASAEAAAKSAAQAAGGSTGGTGVCPTDWSSAAELHIPIPECATVKFSGIDSMPETKTADAHAVMEFWDNQGNYFRKNVILNAQGNSSLRYVKKNFGIDICNDEWAGDDTFALQFGEWVPQDSFHMKAYYTDAFRGVAVVSYKLMDEIVRTRGIDNDRPWKKALFAKNSGMDVARSLSGVSKVSEQLDTGARCFPDGFPCIVYLNGDFYGIYSFQLKKHRDNYHMTKDCAEHVHLDGTIDENTLLARTIDWSAFEVRNPKNLYCYDGTKYEADTNQKKLIDENSEFYALDTDSAKVKAQKETSAKVKAYIVGLSEVMATLRTAKNTYENSKSEDSLKALKATIETYFDVENVIDYLILSDIVRNEDGFSKNWQWVTYDGKKWYICLYDVDMSFGGHWEGNQLLPPLTTNINSSYNNPCGYIVSCYQTDLQARYAELRNAGIIDAEHIAGMLNAWIKRVGVDNYSKEWDKWPDCPVNNDSTINSAYWELVTDDNGDPVMSSGSNYDAGGSYSPGDTCTYGASEYMGYYTFRCIKSIGHDAPIKTFAYRDTVYRVKAWLEQEIANMDQVYSYDGSNPTPTPTPDPEPVDMSLKIPVVAQSSPTATTQKIAITSKVAQIVTVDGSGYFTDAALTANNGTELNLSAYTTATTWVQNVACNISIPSRSSLTKLAFSGGKSFALELGSIEDCTNMTSLDISTSAATGDLSSLAELTKLTELYISDTTITGNVASLSGLTELVYFGGNKTITGDLSGSLSGCTSLKELFLSGTPVTCDGSALPASVTYISGSPANGMTWTGTRGSSAKIIALYNISLGEYVDAMLNDQANGTVGFVSSDSSQRKTIRVNGTRTSASDDAVTALKGKGYTVIVNGTTL